MGKLLSLVRPAGKRNGANTRTPKESEASTSDLLHIVVESEMPVILKPTTTSGGGTPLSGHLQISREACFQDTTIEQITLQLRRTTKTTRPIVRTCERCRSKTEVMRAWTFSCNSKTVAELAQRQFYWSCLLLNTDEQFPETVHTDVGSVTYDLVAKAVTRSMGPVTTVRPLQIQKAHEELSDLRRTWTFPPTSIVCKITAPKQLSSSGHAPVRVRLIGLTKDEGDIGLMRSLNHITWRVMETSVMSSTAISCPEHDQSDKSRKEEHLKSCELSSGRLDHSEITKLSTVAEDQSVSFDLNVDAGDDRIAFDSQPGAALNVSHELRIEFSIVERVVVKAKNSAICSSPRHLQIRVPLILVHKKESDSVWSEEQLPAYQDQVWSPPHYDAAKGCTIQSYQVDSDDVTYALAT